MQRPVEGGEAALDAAQTGAATGVGSAAAVVADEDGEPTACVAGAQPRPRCARVPPDIGQGLGRGEVQRRLDRGLRPRGRSKSSATGTGHSREAASSPPTRPRSASTGGWMPRTRSRSSASALPASARASSSKEAARSGSERTAWAASPSAMPTAASRACAPSWRSRSIRRSSAACASTAAARDSVSCSTRRASVVSGARRRRTSSANPRTAHGTVHQITARSTSTGSVSTENRPSAPIARLEIAASSA